MIERYVAWNRDYSQYSSDTGSPNALQVTHQVEEETQLHVKQPMPCLHLTLEVSPLRSDSGSCRLRSQGEVLHKKLLNSLIPSATRRWAGRIAPFQPLGLISQPSSVRGYWSHMRRRDHIMKTEWSLNPAMVWRVFRVWDSYQVELVALNATPY